MIKNKKYNFFRRLNSRYEMVVLNDLNFEKKLSFKASLGKIILSLIMMVVFLFFLWFYLFNFSPLKNYLPGNPSFSEKESLLKISMALDSLNSTLESKELYVENLKTILLGETPVNIKTPVKNKDLVSQKDLGPSFEDSLFRLNVENEEIGGYSVEQKKNHPIFFVPLKGVVIEKYSKRNSHFGIDILAKKGSFINCISDGVVVISNWTNSTGYVIGVQHNNGFLSIYKHNSSLLKNIGEWVSSGEPIAIIGNSGELSSGPHLHFELWQNGESINPTNYILF